MQEACDATNGTMAAVIGGSVDDVRALCAAHDVDMANLNWPGQTVISGERAKVTAAADAGKAGGKFRMVKVLDVAGAYHSRLMEAPARASPPSSTPSRSRPRASPCSPTRPHNRSARPPRSAAPLRSRSSAPSFGRTACAPPPPSG
jgi:malonyl CoA-acyl carrier protein transacylase